MTSTARMPDALDFSALAVGSAQANDVISVQAGDIGLNSHSTSTSPARGVHSRGKRITKTVTNPPPRPQ